MKLYAVRMCVTKEAVGFFWSNGGEELWWMIDSVTDPGLCEQQICKYPSAIVWSESVDARLGADLFNDDESGESPELDRLIHGLSFDYGFEDYIMCEDKRRWTKCKCGDEYGGSGMPELCDKVAKQKAAAA